MQSKRSQTADRRSGAALLGEWTLSIIEPAATHKPDDLVMLTSWAVC